MTRRLLVLLLLLALPAVGAAQSFSASLTGAAEVPGPGDADGTGFAVVTFSGTTVTYFIGANNIASPTMAHIHRGAAGTSDDVVVDFAPTFAGLSATGSVTAGQAIVDEILANPAGFYVNVHTGDFPNGAVRGQLAVPGAAGGDEELVFPVVISAVGAGGVTFVSDLQLVNLGTASATATVEYWATSPAGLSAPTATADVTIEPGHQAVLADVLVSALGTASGIGGLRVTSDQPISGFQRIFADRRATDEGTNGFSFNGRSSANLKTSGVLPFLSQAAQAEVDADEGFRTNIGYFNSSGSSVTLTMSAYDVAGTLLGTRTVTVPHGSHVQGAASAQIPMSSPVQENFYVTYSASAPILVYGVVADNLTEDTTYVE